MRRSSDVNQARTGSPVHLSPSRIAVLATLFIALLTLIPVRVYENALTEKNYMFGDLLTYGFIAACLGSFLIGVFITARGRRHRGRALVQQVYRASSTFPVAVAIFSLLLAAASLLQFVGTGGSFLAALTSGQGDVLRSAALSDADQGVTALRVLPVGVPLLVWAIFRAVDLKRGRKVIYTSSVLYGAVLLLVLQRNLLIPFVLSVAVVLSAVRFHSTGISLARAFKFVVVLAVLVVGMFAVVGLFRGAASSDGGIVTSFMGYVPASANRLAAVVHRDYSSAFSGQPAFSLRFLWYPPFIRRFLPMGGLASFFGVSIPSDPTQLWSGEFGQIAAAQLNPSFIWPTAFGYTFYDFSWYSCVYFFVIGLTAGYAWRRFVRRTPFGILFYSYICSSIVLWGTDNFLSYPQVWDYVFVILFVRIFDGGRPAERLPAEPARPGDVGLPLDRASRQ